DAVIAMLYRLFGTLNVSEMRKLVVPAGLKRWVMNVLGHPITQALVKLLSG
ncbi:MAG: hypothetical protein RL545_475, partial [Actinomycetota bacterium]